MISTRSYLKREILINGSQRETRVAILEDDRLVELLVDRPDHRRTVGDIYLGRVEAVLPGIQAAFVDIGQEKSAFLHASDLLEPDEDEEPEEEEAPEEDPQEQPEGGEAPVAEAPPERKGGGWRSRDRRRGRRGNGAGEKPATEGRQREISPRRALPNIQDILKKGQSLPVQVTKEPIGSKGCRVTAQISLPGRFLVYMPYASKVGVSRKIESREQRAKLREMVSKLLPEDSGGVIVRTVAEGVTEDHFRREIESLLALWKKINRKKTFVRRAPALLQRETSLTRGIIRDLFSAKVDALHVDMKELYNEIEQYLQQIDPELMSRVHLYTDATPLFDKFDIESEIRDLFKARVELPTGGSLVIQPTEALISIDVNTGRYVGKKSSGRLEDTIVKTNLEAVKEIVRQIRLRDLGGIIVLDLIDMEEKKNRLKVFQEVEKELRRDRSPSKALQVSDFGLVIVTRKRVKQSLERQLTEPCPYCSGNGSIKSASTICFEILVELKKIGSDIEGNGVILRVNPDIARALKEEESGVFREINHVLGKPVTLRPDTHLHHEQFDVMAT